MWRGWEASLGVVEESGGEGGLAQPERSRSRLSSTPPISNAAAAVGVPYGWCGEAAEPSLSLSCGESYFRLCRRSRRLTSLKPTGRLVSRDDALFPMGDRECGGSGAVASAVPEGGRRCASDSPRSQSSSVATSIASRPGERWWQGGAPRACARVLLRGGGREGASVALVKTVMASTAGKRPGWTRFQMRMVWSGRRTNRRSARRSARLHSGDDEGEGRAPSSP